MPYNLKSNLKSKKLPDLDVEIEVTSVEPERRQIEMGYNVRDYFTFSEFIKTLSIGELRISASDVKILVKDVSSFILELAKLEIKDFEVLFKDGTLINPRIGDEIKISYYLISEVKDLLKKPEYRKRYPEYAL